MCLKTYWRYLLLFHKHCVIWETRGSLLWLSGVFWTLSVFVACLPKEMIFRGSSIHSVYSELLKLLPTSIKFNKGTETFKVIKEIQCLSTGKKNGLLPCWGNSFHVTLTLYIWTDLQVCHPHWKSVQPGLKCDFPCLPARGRWRKMWTRASSEL